MMPSELSIPPGQPSGHREAASLSWMQRVLCHGAVAAVLGMLVLGQNLRAAEPVLVQTVRVSKGTIYRSITLPARIHPHERAILYAKVGGYVESIRVDRGDSVSKGDLIASLEVPELMADLRRQEVALQIAKRDFDRLMEAQRKSPDLVTQQAVDDMRGRHELAQADVERTKTLLAFARITAPFDGVVTDRFVDRGAFVPAATASSTPRSSAIITLMNLQKVRVQASVPESETPLITTNTQATVLLDQGAARSFEALVSRMALALDEATQSMLVEVDLPNNQGALRPGMYATMKLAVEHHDGTTLLPISAAVIEKAGTFAFVLSGDKAQRKVLKTGFNDGRNIEILDGIKPGEEVILPGKLTLVDGQPVKLQGAK